MSLTTKTATAAVTRTTDSRSDGKAAAPYNENNATASTVVPYYLRPNALQCAMNERMVELVPELRSRWAQTPMANNRWLQTRETTDKGEPCFIAAASNIDGIRPDYVWMPTQRKGKSNLPAGYYHLGTQEAYIQINALLHRARPRRWGKHKSSKKERELYTQIQNLLYNRLVSDLPDDVHAQRIKALGLQSASKSVAAFGKSAYLPTLTTSLLLSLGGR